MCTTQVNYFLNGQRHNSYTRKQILSYELKNPHAETQSHILFRNLSNEELENKFNFAQQSYRNGDERRTFVTGLLLKATIN